MIPAFPFSNPSPSFRIFILLIFLFSNLSLHLSASPDQFNTNAMPTKRNFSDLSHSDPSTPSMFPSTHRNKKLRRLPHVFSKVLELPFDSDADILIEDRPDCLRFVADPDYDLGEVDTHIVELYPGVKKVVVRKRRAEADSYGSLFLIDEMELDVWRFRLPAVARPELAKAVYDGTRLVVTVPKSAGGDQGSGKGCNEGIKGGVGGGGDGGANLVLVQ